MSVSDFLNVFGEASTTKDLSHLFDTINVNNDDRLTFKDFTKILDDVGVSLSREESRQAYDDIAQSNSEASSFITKLSFKNGVDLSNESANVREIYKNILGGGQYNPQNNRSEIDLDNITESISDTKTDWQHRISCMQSLTRQITNKSMTLDRFHSMFRTYHDYLLTQSKDRRTQVMRAACESLSKIILKWKKDYVRYANKSIEVMMISVRQKIEITHISSAAVVRTILRNVPDSKRLRIMETIGEEATTSKFQDLKADCYQFLCIYFENQPETLKNEDDFWDKLMPYCDTGVKDVANVRDSALWLLALIQRERHDLAFPVIKTMGDHLRSRYDTEYKNKTPNFGPKSNNNGNSKQNNNDDEKKQDDKGPKRHMKKRTWTNQDLFAGFKNMEKKKVENKHKRKPDKKTKKIKSTFPEPPDGQFWNPFCEPLHDRDLKYGFDMIDTKNDRRITFDEFQSILSKLAIDCDMDDAQSYFEMLDVNEKNYIEYDDFKVAYSQKHVALREFWLRLLGAKQLESGPLPSDLDNADIKKLLSDTNGDWQHRIHALHSYTRKNTGTMSQEKFVKAFRRMVGNFCTQVKDRRSAVMRETCICFAKIMMARRAQFLKFAPRVLETLYECIRVKIEIVSITAQQCAKVMVKYVPDSKKFPLFDQIVKGACDKQFAAVRTASFEFINYILTRMVQSDSNRPTKFWDLAHIAFKSGLHDADQKVRELAYESIALAEITNSKQAVKHLGDLSKAAKRKYAEIRQEVMDRMSKQEWDMDFTDNLGLVISIRDDDNESTGSSSTGLGSPTPPNKNKKKKGKVTSPTFDTVPASFSTHRSRNSTSSNTSNSTNKLKDRRRSGSKGSKANVDSLKDRTSDKSKKEKTKTVRKSSVATKSSAKLSSAANNNNSKSKSNSKTIRKGSVATNSSSKSKNQKKDKPKSKNLLNGNSQSNKNRRLSKSSNSSGSGVRSTAKADARIKASRLDKKLVIAGSIDILTAFDNIDDDADGLIEFEGFRLGMRQLDLKPQRGDALKAFAEVDESKEDEIGLDEFVQAIHICNPTYPLMWKLVNTNKYHNIQPSDEISPPSLEECKMTIGDKRSHWKERVAKMRWAVWLILDQKRKDPEAAQMVKKVIDAFATAIKSGDQIVVREACISLGRLARGRKGALSKGVGKLLRTSWEVIDSKIPLIAFSVSQAMRTVIRWVPDDSDNKILKTLIQGSKLKGFNHVRNSCFECISVLIKRAAKQNVTNDFWKMIRDVLGESLKSAEADHDILQTVFKCVLAMEEVNEQKTHRLIENMDNHTKKEWEAYKNNPNSLNGNNKDPSPESDDEGESNDISNENTPDTEQTPENEATPEIEEESEDDGPRQFSSNFHEHKEELSQMFEEYDKENKGFLDVDETTQFLRDLGVTGTKIDIALRGLDKTRRGQILKEDIIYWCFHKTPPSMYPNSILEKECIQHGWLSSRLPRLEKRRELIQELRDMEKAEHNYNGVYDWEMKLAVLNYLIAKAKRSAKKAANKHKKHKSGSLNYVKKIEYVFE